MALESIDLEALFGNIGVMLALTACIAGVGWRTWAKYHDKIMAGEAEAFDRKFFYQALVAFGGSLVLALPLLTAASEMINQWAGTVGYIIAWVMTAAWAYALNDGTNGIIKMVENKAVTRAVKSGELDKAIRERMEFLGSGSKQESQSTQPTDNQPTTGESNPPPTAPVS